MQDTHTTQDDNELSEAMQELDARLGEMAEGPDADDVYEEAKEFACPYANCSAGIGMECVVEHADGTLSTRDSPHAVRVQEANGDR